jgi:hypothetical protein
VRGLDVRLSDGAVLDAAVTLARRSWSAIAIARALEAGISGGMTSAVLLRQRRRRERAAARPKALAGTLPLLRRVVGAHGRRARAGAGTAGDHAGDSR